MGSKNYTIILAAGKGSRMGSDKNKIYLPLMGKPIITHTLDAFYNAPSVHGIILVVSPDEENLMQEQILHRYPPRKPLKIVAGGSERQFSVANGLRALPEDTGIVIVHDGARPLIMPGVIEKSIQTASVYGAAVAGMPAKDTIKQAAPGKRVVDKTLDRSSIWLIQTPQTFKYPIIMEAYARAEKEGLSATDDSALVEAMGVDVRLIEGGYDNLKVTTPEDIILAEAIVGRKGGSKDPEREKNMRIGVGYDIHKLIEGRLLILGGVNIPYAKGLLGHSDADVLTHAIMDALLGAAGLGDIGKHFPDTDDAYRGIYSIDLLAKTRDLIQGAGYKIENIDSIIIAERPKMAPYIEAMVYNIAKTLGIEITKINIKATTAEGLGFAGEGLGIATKAVVLLKGGFSK